MKAINLQFRFADQLVFNASPLSRLFTIIRQEFPKWSSKLYLVRGPRQKVDLTQLSDIEAAKRVLSIATVRGPGFYELQAKYGATTPERQFGDAEIRGTDSSLTIVASFDEQIFARSGESHIWGNRITLQSRGRLATTAIAISNLRTLFWKLCGDLSPAYAFVCTSEEYDVKNMDLSGGGVRAIGIDMAKYFPGIYWQNFFRSDVVQKVWGKSPTLPVCVEQFCEQGSVGFGILTDPYLWDCPDRHACEQDVRHALGEELFFDRYTPERTGTLRLHQLLADIVSTD